MHHPFLVLFSVLMSFLKIGVGFVLMRFDVRVDSLLLLFYFFIVFIITTTVLVFVKSYRIMCKEHVHELPTVAEEF